MSLFRRIRVETKVTLPDIDSEQRWLVRTQSGEVIDRTVGEVAGSGKWFKWKGSYMAQEQPWHALDSYDWLEQLI